MAAHRSTQFDSRGVSLSPCKTDALQDFETALIQFQSYFGDPTEALSHKSNDRQQRFLWEYKRSGSDLAQASLRAQFSGFAPRFREFARCTPRK